MLDYILSQNNLFLVELAAVLIVIFHSYSVMFTFEKL